MAIGKIIAGLCICPPVIMTALVVSNPPARKHAAKAVRHAVTRSTQEVTHEKAIEIPCPSSLSSPLELQQQIPSWGIEQTPLQPFLSKPPLGGGSFGSVTPPLFIQGDVGKVPEPSTWVQLIAGFIFVGIIKRRYNATKDTSSSISS